MTKNKIKLPESIKGKGFCGKWLDNQIGWNIPNHLCGGKRYANKPHMREFCFNDTDRLYLCEITIKPLKDKLGRPITRLAKKTVNKE